jgi:hypothetical protein
MKFYGNGAVWDKERNRILCRFLSGSLDTDDERIIGILTDLGYEYDEPDESDQPEPENAIEPSQEPAKPKPRHRGTPAKRRKVAK